MNKKPEKNLKYGGILIQEKKAGWHYEYIAVDLQGSKKDCFTLFESFRSAAKNSKEEINRNQLKKIMERHAMGQRLPEKMFRNLDDGIFEFKVKSTNLRVCCAYHKNKNSVIILTHYFYKKGGTTENANDEINNAKKILSDYYKSYK